ncbi:MAG: thymidine phosphorylase, partial [Limnochordia bacterium]|nr:thymidine phosphorylase [Limnochordia bacterium]
VYFNGLSNEETFALTKAMVAQSDRLDLSSIPGTKVDKHSTGGVGDKTTIVLVPLLASLGVPMVKLSGRGLGHTGGTVDKLESIPGFSTELAPSQILNQGRRLMGVMAGHTQDLVPVDQRLYQLRDVTATVESLPLIAASIMSKKIASGATALVLDVKVGSGAFMKDLDQARKLAQLMIDIGTSSGVRTVALLTDMSQPLGYCVGNSLEVAEAIDTLKGEGPLDLTLLCVELAACSLTLSRDLRIEDARRMAQEHLCNGQALSKFKEIVSAQGGVEEVISDYSLLPQASLTHTLTAQVTGFITEINAEAVGTASMILGAGRATKDATIDLGAGLRLLAKRGDFVNKGQPLAHLYTNNKQALPEACSILEKSICVAKERPGIKSLIIDRLEGPR